MQIIPLDLLLQWLLIPRSRVGLYLELHKGYNKELQVGKWVFNAHFFLSTHISKVWNTSLMQ